ncbi:MAG: hypothetical protein KDA58_05060 [Planctomycetaceae bacterium]|nr:hypothetical protein [Planctomycetaceae bacterium]
MLQEVSNPTQSAESKTLIELHPRRLELAPIALGPGRYVLGRSSECELRIDVDGVEAQHCMLLVGERRVVIKAIAPLTWVNDEAVRESSLKVGDRLIVGPIEFHVRAATEQSSTPVPAPKSRNSYAPAGIETAIESLQRTATHQIPAEPQRTQPQPEPKIASLLPQLTPPSTPALPRPDFEREEAELKALRIELERQAGEQQRRAEQLQRELTWLDDERNRLNDRQALQEERHAQLSARETELSSERAAIREDRQLLEQERHELQADAQAVRELRAETLSEQQQNRELASELEQQQAALQDRSAELERLTQSLREQEDQLRADQARLTDHEAELLDHAAALDSREHELLARTQEVATEEAALAARRTDLDAAESRLATDREEFAAERSQTQSERVRLEQQRQELDERNRSLSTRQTEIDIRESALEQQTQELQSRENELRKRHQQLDVARDQIRADQERLQQLDSRQQCLDERDVQLADRESMLVERETQLLDRDNQLTDREAELADLNARLVERESQLAERETNLSEREAQLTDRDEERSGAGLQLAEREASLADRQTRLDEREAELTNLAAQLSEREAQQIGRESELSARELQFQTQTEELQQQRDVHQRELEHLQQQQAVLATDQQSLSDRQTSLAEQEWILAERQTNETNTSSELAQALAQIETLEQQLATLSAETTAQADNRTKCIEVVQTELESTRQQLIATQEEVTAHQTKAARFEAELESLKGELLLEEQEQQLLQNQLRELNDSFSQTKDDLTERDWEIEHLKSELQQLGELSAAASTESEPVWEQKCAELTTLVADLKQQLEIASDAAAEHTALAAQFEELQARSTEFEARNQELLRQLESHAHDAAPNADLDDQRARLLTQMQEFEAERKQFEEEQTRLQAKLEEVDDERNAFIIERQSLIAERQLLEERQQEFDQRIQELNEQQQWLNTERDLLETERSQFEQQRADADYYATSDIATEPDYDANDDLSAIATREDDDAARFNAALFAADSIESPEPTGHSTHSVVSDDSSLIGEEEAVSTAREQGTTDHAQDDRAEDFDETEMREDAGQLGGHLGCGSSVESNATADSDLVVELPGTEAAESTVGFDSQLSIELDEHTGEISHEITDDMETGVAIELLEEPGEADASDEHAAEEVIYLEVPQDEDDLYVDDLQVAGPHPVEIQLDSPQNDPLDATVSSDGQVHQEVEEEVHFSSVINSIASAAVSENEAESRWDNDAPAGPTGAEVEASVEHSAVAEADSATRSLRSQLAEMFGMSEERFRHHDSDSIDPNQPGEQLGDECDSQQSNTANALSVDPAADAPAPHMVAESNESADESGTIGESTADDSVAAYMEQLLARTRRSAPASHERRAPEPKPEPKPEPMPEKPVAETVAPSPIESVLPTILSPEVEAELQEQQTPRTTKMNAQEKEAMRANLDSFRELANISARSAVAKSRTVKQRLAFKTNLFLSAASWVAALMLLTAEFWSSQSQRLPGIMMLLLAIGFTVWATLLWLELKKDEVTSMATFEEVDPVRDSTASE